MSAAFDLDAYFARIGYEGPREATLEVLRALHVLHPAAIAFENLTPMMGEAPSLALGALQAKLVTGGRGGYCYEHNTLFQAALTVIGFDVVPLAGRVCWGVPDDAPPRPRSHMLLLVRLAEGDQIADVGFGGAVMTGPLRLLPDMLQQTPHGRFRLLRFGRDAYELQIELDPGVWRPMYRFDLVPHLPADYEPLNWFTATHPSSPFPAHLMAARAGPQGRLALLDARYTIRRPGEAPEERVLTSLEALKSVLRLDFGLTLPAGVDRIGETLGL
jgi:N-hydroxyarylamine O-acetyltransferase